MAFTITRANLEAFQAAIAKIDRRYWPDLDHACNTWLDELADGEARRKAEENITRMIAALAEVLQEAAKLASGVRVVEDLTRQPNRYGGAARSRRAPPYL